MKKVLLTVLLLAVSAIAAEAPKPLPQDAQVKILKAQREMAKLQAQMADLQRQYDQAVASAKQLQTEVTNTCIAAAEQMKVDREKWTCDLNSLALVPKEEEKKPESAIQPAAKEAAVKPAAKKE